MTPLDFESQRQDLIKELSTLFGSLNFDELFRSAVAVETYTATKLRALICANASAIFTSTEIDSDVGIFCCGSMEFQVNISEEVRAPEELLIAILPHDVEQQTKKRDFKSQTIKISGHGRYKYVKIFVPPAVHVDRDVLEHVVKTSLETIYTWVEEQIVATVRAETRVMADELYRHARTVFLDRAIWRELWFAAMSDGYGFRLFDEFVAMSAFDIAQKHSSDFGRGANDVVAEIVKTNLPVQRLLMKHAIGREEPIDVDISDADYSKDHSSYSEAMRAFYGSTSFTIYPILTDAGIRDMVIALYPTSLKSDIEPILRVHRADFREISRKSHSKVRGTLASLQRPSRTSDLLGVGAYIAGKFAKGILEP